MDELAPFLNGHVERLLRPVEQQGGKALYPTDREAPKRPPSIRTQRSSVLEAADAHAQRLAQARRHVASVRKPPSLSSERLARARMAFRPSPAVARRVAPHVPWKEFCNKPSLAVEHAAPTKDSPRHLDATPPGSSPRTPSHRPSPRRHHRLVFLQHTSPSRLLRHLKSPPRSPREATYADRLLDERLGLTHPAARPHVAWSRWIDGPACSESQIKARDAHARTKAF